MLLQKVECSRCPQLCSFGQAEAVERHPHKPTGGPQHPLSSGFEASKYNMAGSKTLNSATHSVMQAPSWLGKQEEHTDTPVRGFLLGPASSSSALPASWRRLPAQRGL